MSKPLVILRKHADLALEEFVASSGFDPEEVWEAMVASPEEQPDFLAEYLNGDTLWERFQKLRSAELEALAELSPKG